MSFILRFLDFAMRANSDVRAKSDIRTSMQASWSVGCLTIVLRPNPLHPPVTYPELRADSRLPWWCERIKQSADTLFVSRLKSPFYRGFCDHILSSIPSRARLTTFREDEWEQGHLKNSNDREANLEFYHAYSSLFDMYFGLNYDDHFLMRDQPCFALRVSSAKNPMNVYNNFDCFALKRQTEYGRK